MKKTPKIKKMLKTVFDFTLTAALSFTVVVGGKSVYTSAKTKNYAPMEQIEEVAKNLNCDLTYISQGKFNKQILLRHNGDKPIYVSIEEGFTEEEKSDIIYTLDNIFGLMKDINSHYTYEIVEEDKMPKNMFTSTIKYKLLGSEEKDDSFAKNYFGNKDLLMNPFIKPTINRSTIVYNRDLIESKKTDRIIVLTHELLHSFGFADVYFSEIGKYYYNTILKASNVFKEYDKAKEFPIITPNDYRCLIALYAEKFKNEQEKNAYINKFKLKAIEYDNLYYGIYKDLNDLNGFDTESLYFNGTFLNKKYEVKVKNNSYLFTIYDKNDNIIERCNGQAINIDGVFFLRNVEFQKGFNPTDKGSYTIADFSLFRDNNFAVIKDLGKNFVVVGNVSEIKDKSSISTKEDASLCF